MNTKILIIILHGDYEYHIINLPNPIMDSEEKILTFFVSNLSKHEIGITNIILKFLLSNRFHLYI